MLEASSPNNVQILPEKDAMRLDELLVIKSEATLTGPRPWSVGADIGEVSVNERCRSLRSIPITDFHPSFLSCAGFISHDSRTGGAVNRAPGEVRA